MTQLLSTSHRQMIRPGSQIAYALPVSLVLSDATLTPRQATFTIEGGELRVGVVNRIDKVGDAWAEADAVYRLVMMNGDVIDPDSACVTDGNYTYPEWEGKNERQS